MATGPLLSVNKNHLGRDAPVGGMSGAALAARSRYSKLVVYLNVICVPKRKEKGWGRRAIPTHCPYLSANVK